jgi:hypothetical protein
LLAVLVVALVEVVLVVQLAVVPQLVLLLLRRPFGLFDSEGLVGSLP